MGGINMRGTDCRVTRNVGYALNAGLIIAGVRSAMTGNKLYGISKDAYRITADYGQAIGNSVQDMVAIDGNHPDMLQFFEKGDGHLVGLRIIGNRFLAFVDMAGSPLLATVQGIGGYGSPKTGGGSIGTTFTDLVVEDNVVECTAWAGMSLTINADGLVQRNRVTDALQRRKGHGWLFIGGSCANTSVRDNASSKLKISANATQSGNVTV